MFRRKKRKKIFFALLLAATIFVVHRFVITFYDIYAYTYSAFLYPILLSQKHIITPIKTYIANKKTNKELQILLAKISQEKEELIAQNIALKATHSFYEQIEEVLEFKKRYSKKHTIKNTKLCHILFRHITPQSHFVIINKGSRHGISSDMIAVYNNCILGKVTEIYPFYSKVVLLTDKSCKVSAYCSKTKSHGICVGDNQDNQLLLTRVSHFKKVKKDDIILSSGHGLVFPQGFALGKILSINPGELYHDITIKTLFDIEDIEYCFLIKKGDC